MDHQHCEEILLNDARLTPEQERDLQIHLRSCPECASLVYGNLALRAAPVIAPARGFTLRFQARLAAERSAQRKRSLAGLFLLALAGMGLLGWFLRPALSYLSMPPERLFTLWLNLAVYLALMVRTASTLSITLLRVASSFMPVYALVLSLALLAGLASLLYVSIHRIGEYSKSAA